MTALALNAVVRVPVAERVVAHIGLGPALFRSKLQFDNEQSQTSNEIGLNTQLRLTYYITKRVMVSAEWKYNSVRFDFPTHGTTEGFETDYKANHLGLGITYAFDWASPWKSINLRETLGLKPAHLRPQE